MLKPKTRRGSAGSYDSAEVSPDSSISTLKRRLFCELLPLPFRSRAGARPAFLPPARSPCLRISEADWPDQFSFVGKDQLQAPVAFSSWRSLGLDVEPNMGTSYSAIRCSLRAQTMWIAHFLTFQIRHTCKRLIAAILTESDRFRGAESWGLQG